MVDKSDVKDMFEKFTWFDRCCFPDDIERSITKSLITNGNDEDFSKVCASSVSTSYKEKGSITAIYQDYIHSESMTDAIVKLVYDMVYKEKSPK